ncbi:hypothetical protein BGX33_000931 [Mortierella sp. NVP41]|nr:hypothetical protein BGX33_000931 [Mortierella sp. NVP41]
MSSTARVPPPPLKLEIVDSRTVSTGKAVVTLHHFILNGTAIHSTPTSINHQVTQLYERLQTIALGQGPESQKEQGGGDGLEDQKEMRSGVFGVKA